MSTFLIATAITGLALFFSRNERLEESYEPLRELRPELGTSEIRGKLRP